MNEQEKRQATERRERRIDEALKETFPASDTPSFVGAGAQNPTDNKARTRKRRIKSEMSATVGAVWGWLHFRRRT
jgi:hypothetical protein